MMEFPILYKARKEKGLVKMAKYFKEEEFCCKHCGQLPENGIDERLLAVLDEAREQAGSPLIVSSGYRCFVHNKNIGGASQSYHVKGTAADVYSNVLDVHSLKNIIKEAMINQNLQGGLQEYTDQEFVHVDVRGHWAEWC